jgi:regulator of RNase E activity RraA
MRCEVNIFGMLATHDDVIHADFHGAVVIPAGTVKQLPQPSSSSCGGRRSL